MLLFQPWKEFFPGRVDFPPGMSYSYPLRNRLLTSYPFFTIVSKEVEPPITLSDGFISGAEKG
jgi:hypothetical protein